MNERRREVDSILKATSVPLLRRRGFKGSYPHFYRVIGEHVDLLMFQFRSDGSSFVVEISYADPARANVGFRPETEPRGLQVSATRKRRRLGADRENNLADHWFSLDHSAVADSNAHYRKLALKVNGLVLDEAEPWWEARRKDP